MAHEFVSVPLLFPWIWSASYDPVVEVVVQKLKDPPSEIRKLTRIQTQKGDGQLFIILYHSLLKYS